MIEFSIGKKTGCFPAFRQHLPEFLNSVGSRKTPGHANNGHLAGTATADRRRIGPSARSWRAGGEFLSAFHKVGQLANGGKLVKFGNGNIVLMFLLEQGNGFHGQQGVASQFEKVVVKPNSTYLKYLFPNANQVFLGSVAGCDIGIGQ